MVCNPSSCEYWEISAKIGVNIKRCLEISLTPETKQQELELLLFREHPDEQQLHYRPCQMARQVRGSNSSRSEAGAAEKEEDQINLY